VSLEGPGGSWTVMQSLINGLAVVEEVATVFLQVLLFVPFLVAVVVSV
jgi:hypothetical protein